MTTEKNPRFFRRFMLIFMVMIMALLAMTITGCSSQAQSEYDKRETQYTIEQTNRATDVAGFPNITNFTEKALLKWILELRDKPNYATYTYLANRDAELVFFGESIGYGIPYSAQFSNPERVTLIESEIGTNLGRWVLPQPEPHGLFVPESSSATFVICVHEGEPAAVYVEPQITVSPFPLTAKEGDDG